MMQNYVEPKKELIIDTSLSEPTFNRVRELVTSAAQYYGEEKHVLTILDNIRMTPEDATRKWHFKHPFEDKPEIYQNLYEQIIPKAAQYYDEYIAKSQSLEGKINLDNISPLRIGIKTGLAALISTYILQFSPAEVALLTGVTGFASYKDDSKGTNYSGAILTGLTFGSAVKGAGYLFHLSNNVSQISAYVASGLMVLSSSIDRGIKPFPRDSRAQEKIRIEYNKQIDTLIKENTKGLLTEDKFERKPGLFDKLTNIAEKLF